ncbi:MAG: DMT family transporter [Bacteroidota bacterium]
MLPLAFAVACSLAIATIFKVAARLELDPLTLLTVNYGAGAFVALAFILAEPGDRPGGLGLDPGLVVLGLGTGALFIAGFFVYALAVQEAGMAMASAVMRLAVVLPFLASWLIWGEIPTSGQLIGLGVAGLAFVLLTRPTHQDAPHATRSGASWRLVRVLGLLFLAGGLGDVAMKVFSEHYGATHSSALFGLFLFAAACGIGLVLVVVRIRRRPTRSELGWGIALGLVNYGSVAFIIAALKALPGPLVFPFNNIAIVMGAAVIGVVLWHERLGMANIAGLVLAGLALVLLTM